MAVQEGLSFCRICSAGCGTRVSVDENVRIVSDCADQDCRLWRGYACFKGLQTAEGHYGPARRLHPLKRQNDGYYVEIGSEQALDEIAEKLGRIVERDGLEALAIFLGNEGMFNIPGYVSQGFLEAFGSDQYFSTLTMDQSAKSVSFGGDTPDAQRQLPVDRDARRCLWGAAAGCSQDDG